MNQFHEFSWIPSGEEVALRDHCHGWHDGRGVETLQRCDNQGLSSEVDKQTRWKDMMYLEFITSSSMMMMMMMKKMKTHRWKWTHTHIYIYIIRWRIHRMISGSKRLFCCYCWYIQSILRCSPCSNAGTSLWCRQFDSSASPPFRSFLKKINLPTTSGHFFPRFFGFPFQPVRSYLQPNNLDGNAKLAWLGWSLHSATGTLLKLHK